MLGVRGEVGVFGNHSDLFPSLPLSKCGVIISEMQLAMLMDQRLEFPLTTSWYKVCSKIKWDGWVLEGEG